MSNELSIPDALSNNKLQAMAFVAKMKEAADNAGCGFIGGFIDPNGEKFIMSNFSDEERDQYLPQELL